MRLVTYTLQDESGVSPRAAGMKIVGEVKGHDRWETRSNPNGVDRVAQSIYKVDKFRWQIGLATGKPKPHFPEDVGDAAKIAWEQELDEDARRLV